MMIRPISMLLPTGLRRSLWPRRVAAARASQEAERQQAVEQNAAVRRILGLAEQQHGISERTAG
jgi:hypothetical protein